ncbi:hypothetical protein ND856_18580 [Leptospira bandrabouensis]|uniref:hypothetical protein n=1 Tax=Leptospira bandrabouensis TaxID=2484903 RepID=UPI00223E5BC3|nr:hypothetical protein [Leptospira bandrabouensis]MCW7460170.1 hypothetical protein [Leptospira bandrabouensis]MCW7479313.1 hypothetical protein [Leptospira bandrabouensis]MCW7486995.1 hypothetical protein [Leptospira bandrabouensis]
MNPEFRSTQREYEAFYYREKRKGKTPLSKELYDLERIQRGKFRNDGVYVGIEWTQRLGLPKYLKEFYNPETGKLDLQEIKNLCLSLEYQIENNRMTRNKRHFIRQRIRQINQFVCEKVHPDGMLKSFGNQVGS